MIQGNTGMKLRFRPAAGQVVYYPGPHFAGQQEPHAGRHFEKREDGRLIEPPNEDPIEVDTEKHADACRRFAKVARRKPPALYPADKETARYVRARFYQLTKRDDGEWVIDTRKRSAREKGSKLDGSTADHGDSK